MFDVVQIGYGPVSQTLALMLGRQGRSVLVCERWQTRYPLPRAVCIDHELYRVLAANGMGPVLPGITERGPLYQWFNADWQKLLEIDWSSDSISGGPEVNFVHQPTVEEALDKAVAGQASVETWLGWEAVAVHQDAGKASVELRNTETGETRTVESRYVVGCDGANSLVRETIGGTREDRGFEADWLVIDVLLKPGVTIQSLGIPAAGQYCNPARPTTIVPAGVREGRTFRRWEFMRLPGESIESLEREEKVWELISPWAGPDDIELVRHKVYNFRSLLAAKWRDGRLLVAGDAAHVMPPFMGQGMCAGMRDAWNLAWKLGLILDGRADDRLLDSYQPERMPHVSQIIDMSIFLGKIICVPDAEAAAARDEAFLTGNVEPMPPFPALTGGLIHHGADGAVSPGAGLLSPHVTVEAPGFTGRLDELTGTGFVAIARDFDGRAALSDATREAMDALGVRFLVLGESLRDCDGRIEDFLTANGWNAMIVRPDYYVYGGAADAPALERLAAAMARDLAGAGVRLSPANPQEVAAA
ncbi:bifunctional 3-(3-hydroxy-phenyl)propionate/3-hydroxycinnamic acid hydroxylase [Sphingomonas sp. AOB5]|uniref:bifunctional 3-(3-hydroxy-phenyl)propionate/3-hydroxycinnamic acid hydroxylase MhpA n=1 Tax=Sphingomonas sp. AOB5 TaxID=3034017 RepID=UPI0023F8D844|nr:bifunctional 3-(3-hydroxy-phenyl)propionate/3-hydroxycinnamic acid hydroxylase [Sphingomonas sp. AOB5]MDF7776456.1 bifunctional 3-(3-hydroxy-phenyl)propionate/3-hydroxycinnamic acid hydroxylase [Sphingomonas sp. AOB5]